VKFSRLNDEDIFKELIGKFNCPVEEARGIIPLADGNINRAVKILKKDEDEVFFLEKFKLWMRLCYQNNLGASMGFVAEMAKLGREKQKNFLAYTERIVRNALLINYNSPHLARLNGEERDFLIKFGRFINYSNIARFNEELEKAQFHIDRNANPTILFMDLSMTITILLLTGEKAVSKN
jgi:DNA polymerase-3 subunit delta'